MFGSIILEPHLVKQKSQPPTGKQAQIEQRVLEVLRNDPQMRTEFINRVAAGSRALYNGNWLLRAVGSKLGIYGNDAAEATYPFAKFDQNGHPLDGSKHQYTVTFPAGQLPPVHAFWSITMYDANSQFLIENPISRYLINAPMLPDLQKNHDGSLTIYVQHGSPGRDKESNWLPAPDGPIFMVMRMYWPKETPPSVLPPGQGTWHLPLRDLHRFARRPEPGVRLAQRG